MKRTLFLLAALLWACGIAFAQSPQQERLSKHVYFFAADSLRGRDAGSADADKAAKYIVRQFEEIGVEPFFEDGFYQNFEHNGAPFKNIVGVIRGNDPVLKDEYIIIGAHYDHVGVKDGKVYNGADDNASGSATIIEMARILKERQGDLKRSVMVVAFDAEEKGLWGSNDLVEKLDLDKIKLMMSIDMVGWLHKGKTLQLQGVATIKDGKKLVKAEASKMDLDIKAKNFETSIFGATDTQGCAKKKVPTLYVTTGLKSPYHKPEDDAELIDYQGMDKITSYMADVTESLANDDNLHASGKIAPIHGGKKSVFEVGPTVSVIDSYIAFPDAGFESKSMTGFNAGLATQTHIGNFFTLEVKALYEQAYAKFPDANDFYGSFLKYRQQAVVDPAHLLIGAGKMGLNAYLGVGGFYAYVFDGKFTGNDTLVVDKNQWGISWCAGVQVGHVKLSFDCRYQLNPFFAGEDGPKAQLRTSALNLYWFF